jgi:hypothetical protein
MKKYKHIKDTFSDIGEVMVCYYCGVPADSKDHVTPRALKSMIGNEIENPVRSTAFTVSSCRECNSALNCGVYETLTDRKFAAKEHIRKKYGKYLKIPEWTEDELAELGHSLRSHVLHGIAMKKLTRMRLNW